MEFGGGDGGHAEASLGGILEVGADVCEVDERHGGRDVRRCRVLRGLVHAPEGSNGNRTLLVMSRGR